QTLARPREVGWHAAGALAARGAGALAARRWRRGAGALVAAPLVRWWRGAGGDVLEARSAGTRTLPPA
ncbi:hypothetical protein, partial [Brevibacterium casei]|uniref:hypothetical protein n=1 Tax=Brevibacterium casei TaxID=33889 RepID=UPI00241C07AE